MYLRSKQSTSDDEAHVPCNRSPRLGVAYRSVYVLTSKANPAARRSNDLLVVMPQLEPSYHLVQ
ncbi:hypothetical protein B0G71_8106 [Paraburkholderia sp. BL27I4N3]|nr:hypothetical protein B0G71_8106 [Paraburkholderia sp. BL27I4N3]